MKNEREVRSALDTADDAIPKYFGMTYEDGIKEALGWVLGDIDDTEFEYAAKKVEAPRTSQITEDKMNRQKPKKRRTCPQCGAKLRKNHCNHCEQRGQ